MRPQLLMAVFGLIISERSGVLTLTAEGLILIGAAAAIGCDLTCTGRPLATLLAAATVLLLFGALMVSLRVKQVIAGVTAVFFCEKLSTLLGWQNHPVAGMLGVMIPGLTELPVLGRTVVG